MIRKYTFLFLLIFFVSGCATGTATKREGPARQAKGAGVASPTPSPVPVKKEAAPPRGIVFAKTVFEGVLKTSYVRLTIVPLGEENAVHHLFIGDQSRQQGFPWVPETVQPDYFIIELPPGEYQITEISIPVGTSLAQEPVNITFTVLKDKALYLGTLLLNGTKERIRFGGVPIIQPGFDYEVEIFDERSSAIPEFRKRMPQYNGKVDVELMDKNPTLPMGLSEGNSTTMKQEKIF